MKKTEFNYSKPEIELIRLSAQDVITASDGDDTEWDPQIASYNKGSY